MILGMKFSWYRLLNYTHMIVIEYYVIISRTLMKVFNYLLNNNDINIFRYLSEIAVKS